MITQIDHTIHRIHEGKASNLYLVHGEETYLVDEAVDRLIDALCPLEARPFNLNILPSDSSVDEMIATVETYPVFADRRVVVTKDPEFLISTKDIKPGDYLKKSMEQYHIGNLDKSARMLVKALGLSSGEFEGTKQDFKKAIDLFIERNELSEGEIKFLSESIDLLMENVKDLIEPSLDDDVDRLINWLNTKSTFGVIIIALSFELDKSHKLVKAVAENGTLLCFNKLKQSTYVNRDPMFQMVLNRLKEHKKLISPEAFLELQKKTGNDMRQIFDELEKLVTFIGNRQRIEKRDVEELVARSSFDDIFDLTNAVAQRSLPMALAKLESLLDKGEHPVLMLSMLIRQFRLLLQAKLLIEGGYLKQEYAMMNFDIFQQRVLKSIPSDLIGRLPESKQSNILKQPYPLHVTIRYAKNFTVDQIIKAMEKLLDADIQIKTGSLTPKLVLQMLVIDLCITT